MASDSADTPDNKASEDDLTREDATEAGDASVSLGPLRLGKTVVAHYRILAELGRGGQGVVYLAEDTRLGRKVALKFLIGLGDLSGSTLARFKREAQIASKLHHPGICTVYEAGVEQNTPYMAMQYVEGESMHRKIKRAQKTPTTLDFSGVFDLDQTRATGLLTESGDSPGSRSGGTFIAIDDAASDDSSMAEAAAQSLHVPRARSDVLLIVGFVEGVARALQHAHETGVLHRDIKPANILVTPDGKPVILDFGLARDLQGNLPTLTETGGFLGTPAYMSPEQLQDTPVPLDSRTDIFSLGVTLYESLTLQRPFGGHNSQALLRAILYQQPVDPRRLNPTISRDLKVVIEKALEKDRDRRYQSALELADDLARVQAQEPVKAKPAGPALRLTRWVQRNTALAVVTLLLAALLTAIGIIGYMLTSDAPGQAPALDEIGRSRFTPDRTTYFTRRSTVRLYFNKRWVDEAVTVALSGPERSMPGRFEKDPGRDLIILELPASTGSGSEFIVTGTGSQSSEPLFRFSLIFDSTPPVIRLLRSSMGGFKQVAPGEAITVLQGDQLRFKFVDTHSGLLGADGEAVHELDIPVSPSDENSFGQGNRVVRIDDEILMIHAVDNALNPQDFQIRLQRIDPIVRVAERIAATRENTVQIKARFMRPDQQREITILPRNPVAFLVTVPGVEFEMLFSEEDGCFVATLELPNLPASGATTHGVGFRYGKNTLKNAGGPLTLLHDQAPPVITLLHEPGSGTDIHEYSADSASRETFTKRKGTPMHEAFRIRVRDDSLGASPSVQLRYGDFLSTSLDLQDSICGLAEPPAGEGRFPVTVVATDEAGNRASLQFEVLVEGSHISLVTASGASGDASEHEGALHLRDGGLIDISVKSTEELTSLYVEARDAGDRVISTLRKMSRVEGRWSGSVQIPVNGPSPYRALLRFSLDPGGRVDIHRLWLVVDSAAPTVDSRILPDYRDGRAPDYGCATLPRITLTMTDDAGLGRDKPDLLMVPDPGYTRTDEIRDDRRTRMITLMPQDATEIAYAEYSISLTGVHDRVGNVTDPFSRTIKIKNPGIQIVRIGGDSVRPDSPTLRAVHSDLRLLKLHLKCTNPGGRYRIKAEATDARSGAAQVGLASIEARDAEPGSIEVVVPSGDRGEVRVFVREEAWTGDAGRGWTAALPAPLRYVIDQTPPEWRLLVNDIDLGRPAGPVRITPSDEVTLFFEDDTGLVESLVANGYKLPSGSTSGSGSKVFYHLALKDLRDHLRISARLEDLVGRTSPVQLTLHFPQSAASPDTAPTTILTAADERARAAGLEWVAVRDKSETTRAFDMSRTEVTWKQFQAFGREQETIWETLRLSCRETGARTQLPLGGWNDFRSSAEKQLATVLELNTKRSADDDHPVCFVSPRVALAFAIWVGGRLPTVAEWRGAAGLYLKSEAAWPLVRKGNTWREANTGIIESGRNSWCRVFDHSVVGVSSLETAHPFGLSGLIGNAAELAFHKGGFRVLGGSYDTHRSEIDDFGLRVDLRVRGKLVATHEPDVGFRVVRSARGR